MSTKIEWADETWSPITGCDPVSAGCEHCYARRMAYRLRGGGGYPLDDPFRPGNYRGDYYVRHNKCRLIDQPFHWRKGRKIFVCSMGDIFHRSVKREDLSNVCTTIGHTENRHHTFMLLTKRKPLPLFEMWFLSLDPRPANIWIGVTGENQMQLNLRWEYIRGEPATVRFVSIEPLLSPVQVPEDVDWVVLGTESGRVRRYCDVGWIRDVRDQCIDLGIPFFLKQMGGMDGNLEKRPLLDGRRWEQYPGEERNGF